jgi:SAM-dependent MidA family methyltransferase
LHAKPNMTKASGHTGCSAASDRGLLPPPSPEEQAHSEQLARSIREEIARCDGAIPFARFMELALYAPGLGYYSAGRHKFGAAGDFLTAAELGPLFARCLAHPCRQVLQSLDGGEILEAGAGSGVLAADLLLALESLACLPPRYLILELSAALRARQADTLKRRAPHLLPRVRWLDEWPAQFRGIVLANELLDAMPVERFRLTAEGVRELHVASENEHFAWTEKPASPALQARIEALALSPTYTSEINRRAEAWVRSAADVLDTGVLLLIDYGFPRAEFYHPQRCDGTLMCHYRHRVHADPLILVGLQDITAHVDFSAVAMAGQDAGLKLLGYTSQAAFLIGCGLEQLVAASDPHETRAHLALTQQIKKLTLPHEMGELYKVMALGRGVEEPLLGFTVQDRRARL